MASLDEEPHRSFSLWKEHDKSQLQSLFLQCLIGTVLASRATSCCLSFTRFQLSCADRAVYLSASQPFGCESQLQASVRFSRNHTSCQCKTKVCQECADLIATTYDGCSRPGSLPILPASCSLALVVLLGCVLRNQLGPRKTGLEDEPILPQCQIVTWPLSQNLNHAHTHSLSLSPSPSLSRSLSECRITGPECSRYDAASAAIYFTLSIPGRDGTSCGQLPRAARSSQAAP